MLTLCDLLAVISLAATFFGLGYTIGRRDSNNRQPRN